MKRVVAASACPTGETGTPAPLDARSLAQLKWRCRRGMLENDLLIERFFERHGGVIDASLAAGVLALMDLPDNELLDLLLRRTELAGDLDCCAMRDVLCLMRVAPPSAPL